MSEPRVLRISTFVSQHPPTILYGVAIWKWKKWEMDKETQRKSRQRMQKKDNTPCNNQLNRTKRKEDKKKVTSHQENCLPKSASERTRSNKIPQLPPKRTGSNKIPHSIA
jgi:hypothetical protein